MSIKGGGFKRKSETSSDIPSSSLADIAFLLLIFFMVTTVFRTDNERDIIWPGAEATEKIDEKKKDILNIWVERNGSIFINDQAIQMDEVSAIVAPLYRTSERRLVISIRGLTNSSIIKHDDYVAPEGKPHRRVIKEAVLTLHYVRPGDEFAHNQDPIRYEGRRWIDVTRTIKSDLR